MCKEKSLFREEEKGYWILDSVAAWLIVLFLKFSKKCVVGVFRRAFLIEVHYSAACVHYRDQQKCNEVLTLAFQLTCGFEKGQKAEKIMMGLIYSYHCHSEEKYP